MVTLFDWVIQVMSPDLVEPLVSTSLLMLMPLLAIIKTLPPRSPPRVSIDILVGRLVPDTLMLPFSALNIKSPPVVPPEVLMEALGDAMLIFPRADSTMAVPPAVKPLVPM